MGRADIEIREQHIEQQQLWLRHQHAYPLTQTVSVFVNRPPGKPMDSKVQEFLSFVLSREGQQIIRSDRGYLPLTPEVLTQEREKLSQERGKLQ